MGTPSRQEKDVSVRAEVAATLTDLLPWGISSLLHAGIVLLSLFLVWTTTHPGAQDDGPVSPVNGGLQAGTGLGLHAANGTGGRMAGLTDLTRRRLAASPGSLLTQAPGGGPRQDSPLIGRGLSAGLPDLRPLRGGGEGIFSPAPGPYRPGTPGDPNGDDTPGPSGNGRPPKTLAYVIDASGSLIDNMPFVVTELKNSLRRLDERQSFAVLFFQDGQVLEAPGGMKPATGQRIHQVFQWLDTPGNVAPRGVTSPLPALRLGLGYRPEMMYILSDNITGRGKYALDPDVLLAEVAKANVAGTRIYSIQFVYPDPAVAYGRKPTLELIAKATNGSYRFVPARELDED